MHQTKRPAEQQKYGRKVLEQIDLSFFEFHCAGKLCRHDFAPLCTLTALPALYSFL